ncbi:hypothetical protein ACFSGI_14510 [Paenibacillus nicotianae]|uniref:Uncharacterized protein n=2 Tax=Paenibacillus nicotianae TaxID=1526551 RepID=A0ABW4V0T6_9BACL
MNIIQRLESDAVQYLKNHNFNSIIPENLKSFIELLNTLGDEHEYYYDLKEELLKDMSIVDNYFIQSQLKEESIETIMINDFNEESNDSAYESSLLANSVKIKKRKINKNVGKYLINKKFYTEDMHKTKKGPMKKRSKKYGGIYIEMEIIKHSVLGEVERPVSVIGYVEPTSTTGRVTAPEPSSGLQVGIKWKEVGERNNTGIVDAQKGHIMALELGGPDVPRNIVPQWANWQGNGVWREAEKEALKRAKSAFENHNKLWFEASVLYKPVKNLRIASHKSIAFPTGFKMKVQERDMNNKEVSPFEILFDDQQVQNHTDEMIAERAMIKIDNLDSESDSDEE